MTNIYAALQRAKKQRETGESVEEHPAEEPLAEEPQPEEQPAEEQPPTQEREDAASLSPQRSPLRVPAFREKSPFDRLVTASEDLRLSDQMTLLYENIASILSSAGGKTIQFIGVRRDEGASVLVREFAKVAALVLGKSVLLLDAHQKRPNQLQYFGIQPRHGWEECVRDGKPLKDVIHRVGGEALYVSQLAVRPSRPPRVCDLPRIGEFFEGVKQRFDLVLLDSPAATEAADGLALSRRVDGVILIVEAEKTGRHTAEKVRERIEDLGGPLLGVILNKRRYPIPGFIYGRL